MSDLEKLLQEVFSEKDLNQLLVFLNSLDVRKIPIDKIEFLEKNLISRPCWTTFDLELEKLGIPALFYKKLKENGIPNSWEINMKMSDDLSDFCFPTDLYDIEQQGDEGDWEPMTHPSPNSSPRSTTSSHQNYPTAQSGNCIVS